MFVSTNGLLCGGSARIKAHASEHTEYQIVRTHLEWLSEIPWSKVIFDTLDIDKTRSQLEEDHYGLEPVRKCILEFLAVSVNYTGMKQWIIENKRLATRYDYDYKHKSYKRDADAVADPNYGYGYSNYDDYMTPTSTRATNVAKTKLDVDLG
ncbi:ATP-dependent protease La [Gigaspora margarita]|uniref:ATP-dependent protease La n=1 Tax=Gigaspora margarita TaxID=4874 RepID=A0A8H4AA90_GIGMA|nr:ATP-dependent protease La [Gigaspora margarita]